MLAQNDIFHLLQAGYDCAFLIMLRKELRCHIDRQFEFEVSAWQSQLLARNGCNVRLQDLISMTPNSFRGLRLTIPEAS